MLHTDKSLKRQIMKKVTDKAESRGRSSYDWLDSRHTFSFDKYYTPRRMNFGALRVLNDDRIAPGKGFGTHPHKNMEIISIPLKGKLKHGDSKQNSRTITIGDIQTMSAGTGIYHSEMNGSDTEPAEFLQIWVIPEKLNTPPAYQDYDIPICTRTSFRLSYRPTAMLLPGCCNRHGSPSEKSRPERSWDITCTSRTPACTSSS